MEQNFKTTSTSFVKTNFNSKVLKIKGARLSSRSSEHIISSGLSSLDYYFGGGLPVGSLLFVEDGASNKYASYLLKHFVSEGIASDQSIFIAGEQPKDTLLNLPSFTAAGLQTTHSFKEPKGIDKSMGELGSAPFSHFFDLSSTIPESIIENANITFHEVDMKAKMGSSKNILNLREPYCTLLHKISERLQDFSPESQAKNSEKDLLRIALTLPLPPLLGSLHLQKSVSQFLWLLRALIKKSYATAMVLMPAFPSKELFHNLQQFGDICLKFEPFIDETGEKVAFGGFQGLIHITRLSSLDFLMWPKPNTQGLAFSLTSQRFSVQKFNLTNPEEEETNEA